MQTENVTGITTTPLLQPVLVLSPFEEGYPKIEGTNASFGDLSRVRHIQKALDLPGEKGKTGWFTVDDETTLVCVRRGNTFFFFNTVKFTSSSISSLTLRLSSKTEPVGIDLATWAYYGCEASMSEAQIMQAVAHKTWSTHSPFYWLNYTGHMIVAERSGNYTPEIFEIAGYARTSDHVSPYMVFLREVNVEYFSSEQGRKPRLVFGADRSRYVATIKLSELNVFSLFDSRYDKV